MWDLSILSVLHQDVAKLDAEHVPDTAQNQWLADVEHSVMSAAALLQ